ncbi:MAG: glycosyltransferase family 39 protein, partial [Deltaproteobacteria bacterium]|nr:glycosyltransferase family 39 protein [Deltaproteobacteria bacterium]
NVVFDSSLPSGSPTPQALGLAVQALADAARSGDGMCRDLSTAASARHAEAAVEREPPFPWTPAALAVLVFAALGLAARRASRKLPEAWKERIFWAAVLLFTAAGAALRLADLSSPFCESSFTQRVELAESPLWQILTYQVLDGRHPPMTALLLHLTLPLGRSEWAVRLPFVIAACLSLPLVALLGRRIEGRLAGAAACLACALLQPLVTLGHQASSHALLFALAPCMLLSLLWMLEKPEWLPCLALAAANTALLWTNYLAAFLVGPQLVLLMWSGSRIWMARALAIAGVLGALPLYRMIRGLVQDAAGRAVSERAPEVVWGDATVGQVLAEAVAMAGTPFSVACALLGVAGAILLILEGRGAAGRGFAVVLSASAWLVPLAVLALTPFARMKGRYMHDVLPLLVLLAVMGAVIGARRLTERFAPRRPLVGAAAAWGAAFLLAAMAAWPAYRDGPRALAYSEQTCSYDEAARIIAQSDVRTAILLYGHSRTLVGYYLGGSGEPLEDRTGLESWRYGGTTLRTLCRFRELGPDWQAEAEARLELLTSREPAWIVDVTHVEHTWPALEQAGRCRVHAALDGLRLLLCGQAGGGGTVSR